MIHVDYPFRIDGRGRTALAADEGYIRNLSEQVLFTSPGERVNRPSFGSGLLQLVFAPNSAILAGTIEMTVQAALQQWLADLIVVESVNVVGVDSRLEVEVRYIIRVSQQRTIAQFSRTV